MRSPTLTLSYAGAPLQTILAQLPPEVENVLLCGQPPSGHSGLVAWVYKRDVLGEWTDAGTYLGQEEDQAPTIALARGGHTVRVRFASAWFDQAVTADQAAGAFA